MVGKRKRRHAKPQADLNPNKKQKIKGQNTEEHGGVENALLDLYYPKVATLRTFLLDRLPKTAKPRRAKLSSIPAWLNLEATSSTLNQTRAGTQPSEIASSQLHTGGLEATLSKLLDTTLVGYDKYTQSVHSSELSQEFKDFSQKIQQSQPTCSHISLSTLGQSNVPQRELIDFAIHHLFFQRYQNVLRPPHVLCYGYIRSKEDASDVTAGIHGLDSWSVNSQVSTLKGAVWQDLLELLGRERDGIMLDLVLNCGLFMKVESGNDNYYQLSGTSLSDLPMLKEESRYDPKPPVIHNSGQQLQKNKAPAILRKPSRIAFVRNRMFYTRPHLNAKGDVRFGLPHIHALNRCSANLKALTGNPDSESDSAQTSSSDVESQEAERQKDVCVDTVHLMMYVFPRQFGLHNVFTSHVSRRETTHAFKDYTLREDEINTRLVRARTELRCVEREWSPKLPRRLRGPLIEYMKSMLRRHIRCSYTSLLRHYCPVDPIDNKIVARTKRKRQGRSGQPLQPSLIHMARLVRAGNASLTSTATPLAQVSAFCRASIAQILPSALLGSGEEGSENWRHLMRNIDHFVRCHRFERMDLHWVIQEMKLNCIPWLAPSHLFQQQKISKGDLEKRKELLLELLYYIFDSLLIPILRMHFNITESNTDGNKLFFFRHDVWRIVSEPSMNTIKTSMLEEIPAGHAYKKLRARQLGFSHMRFVPKGDTVRPLMNMKRRPMDKKKGRLILGKSINDILKPVSSMLNFEKGNDAASLGASLFSIGELYPKLAEFASEYRAGNQQQPLYFVKVDVQKCFDTIPQAKMIDVIKRLCDEDEYCINKHAEIRYTRTNGYGNKTSRLLPQKKFPALARHADNIDSFENNVKQGPATKKRDTIFVDFVQPQSCDANKLLKLLEEHVQENWIKIGKRYYRQKKGIPQGSSVSSLLCNLFYANFEREQLGFLEDDSHLLSRLIDDFLLITTSLESARRFVQIMHRGNDDYGIGVKTEKTLVNFSCSVGGVELAQVQDTSAFPYCGIALNTKTLEVSKDISRRLETSMRNSLTVALFKMPGQAFYQKTIRSFKNQLYAMLTDTQINTLATVLSTLYMRFVETSMKMHRYVKSLPRRTTVNNVLLIKTADDLIDMAFTLVKSKQRNPSTRQYQCSVSKAQVQWLATTAFRRVLHTKHCNYTQLLRWLDQKRIMAEPSGKTEILRLNRIAEQADKVFSGYKF